MNPQSILLVQSETGSVIMIALLLLVAGVVGYLTAWFYAKSVFKPIIKSLEEEKKALNNQVSGLKNDVTNLNGSLNKLNEKIEKLEKEIAKKKT